MTAQEVLDLVRGLGFTLRAEDGSLHVSPGEKLTPELRDLLHTHKPELIDLLTPETFVSNLRGKVARLERESEIDATLPECFVLIVHTPSGCAHSSEEVQRWWVEHVAQTRAAGGEPGFGLLVTGGYGGPCPVCGYVAGSAKTGH